MDEEERLERRLGKVSVSDLGGRTVVIGDYAEYAHALLVNAGYEIVRVDVPDTEPRAQRPWRTDVRAVQARRLARKMGRR